MARDPCIDLPYKIIKDAQLKDWAQIYIWCDQYVGSKKNKHEILWNVSWKAYLDSTQTIGMHDWCWSFLHEEHAMAFRLTWGGVQVNA